MTQTFETIQLSIKENGIADLRFNRPDVNNAMNETLIAEITEAMTSLASNDAVRIIVLSGEGKHFSAGADLNWMKKAAGYSEQENFEDAMRLSNMLNALYASPKPVIAVTHGAIYGGGVGITACADIVFANPSSQFCLSEVRLGLTPATISPFVIAAMGERQARRYFLTAEVFDAEKAEALGLVHEVSDNAFDDAMALAEKMLKLAPEAMGSAKRLIEAVSPNLLSDDLRADTAKRIARRRATDEAKEGITAFLEKRKPSWIKA